MIPQPQQTPWEFARLLVLIADLAPRRILEVGIYEGGTLWHWLQLAQSVTAIDDAMRPPGTDAWKDWAADAGTELVLLHGSSFDPEIVEWAASYGPYEFCLIDADHTYDSAKADWENYSPMVAPDGIVAFHDILPRPGYGVDRLWAEIKSEPGRRTVEIVEAGNESPCGIGAVWM